MAGMGYRVTVFPALRKGFDVAAVYADLPDTVEVMHDRGLADLEAFLINRRGTFDTIWIARTHNLDRVKPVLERGGVDVLGNVRVVLDTEAIAAPREATGPSPARLHGPIRGSRRHETGAGKRLVLPGHRRGERGENWAAVASLVENCKLNAVDPQRYLAELLTRLINRWPQSRIDELLPWCQPKAGHV